MSEAVSIKVHGLRELNSALKHYNKELKKELEVDLRLAAQTVADEARKLFASYDEKSAAGFRPRIRGLGRVVVEQRRGRTTGFHPDYGALQMRRALLPALARKQEEVVKSLERMLDDLGHREGF